MENTDLIPKNEYTAEVGEFPVTRRHFIDDNLPVEDPELFSEDPLTFEEMTVALWQDVETNYCFSKILNRFSVNYLETSRSTAKGISKLASCCLTKAVLEKKGLFFPLFDNLNIEELYKMVSFNFRKCHAAVDETQNKNYQLWSQLLEMEFNWHALAERLKATEEKIRNIRDGKINVDSLIRQAEYFRQNSGTAQLRPQGPKLLPPSRAKAFPIMKQEIREAIPVDSGKPKSESRKAEAVLVPESGQRSAALPPEDPEGDPLEKRFRETVARFNSITADIDRIAGICGSVPDEVPEKHPPISYGSRSGPSNETRKKLREKRKRKRN